MKNKLFEEWAKTHNYKTKIEEGFYTNTHTQSAWEAWKASTPRELSDDEITFLWHQSMNLAISDDNLKNNISHATIFAKAILKKASEK
jgi:hypothetical protein